MNGSGWLCLLAGVLHLLAPLCPACPALNRMAKADAMGRVTAESSHGQVHHYEYDLAGNRVKATYSTGRVVETSYDGLNRPEAIVDGDRLTRYGYDKAGRAVILVAANGQTSNNTYDALGRLTDRVLYKTPAMDPAQRLAQFQWEHDLLGNVTKQEEIWPGETTRAAGVRSTTMGYDDNNRLTSETISHPTEGTQSTTYTYDDANNRGTKTVTGGAEPGHWDYTYNAANQLVSWTKRSAPAAPVTSILRSATLTYDDAGNRTSQTIQEQGTPNPEPRTTAYTWDSQDRLASVTLPNGSEHRYAYDYRTRRIGTHETPSPISNPPSAAKHTAIVFSGGLSVAEWEQESGTGLQPVLSAPPTVEYTRGPDMGGGVGGLLYTSRSESASASVSSSRTLRYNLSNGRGDIVAQSDAYASLTWTASYEAYGKRTKETGENKDKQRGNSKDEDPTGLLNEGFRYRDIETGVWLSRDPAGFVDGPNLYAYIKQNPWSAFDPKGLALADITGEKRNRDSSKHLKELDDIVNKASDNLEKKGFTPSNPNNPGEFGTALHDEVGSITSSQKNIHTSVVVKEVKGMFGGVFGSDWEIVSVGKGAGAAGATEIDLMKTADGYELKAGQMLDRSKVLAAAEIKSSVNALKGMDFSPGGQGARLNRIFSSDKLAAVVPDRGLTSKGWGFSKLAGAGAALAVFGMFNQVHAISNIDKYNDKFDNVINSAGTYRAGVQAGVSDHESYMNYTQFVLDSHAYMSNFTDSIGQGIVTEMQLRAGVSKHYGK